VTAETFDVVIIGAGAAGLMCAATAGARGRRVLLLEHTGEPGAKILISGGGRCNFTNRSVTPGNFLSSNRHFCTSALSQYGAADFIALVERHGIAYQEKALGQLFCTGSARAIVAMLLAECDAAGVTLRLNQHVGAIEHAGQFRVTTDTGTVTAPSLVLATGGLSIPKLGATGFAYDIAQRFGLQLTPREPALVPLTFGGEALELMRPLSGVSLPAAVQCDNTRFDGAVLFTHRGLSGPAILQISSYWQPGRAMTLDLLPGRDAGAILLEAKRSRPRAGLRSILADHLPQRLAAALAAAAAPPIADWSNAKLADLAGRLARWTLTPAGTEGYAKAEVTRGGVDTAGLSSKTMEVRSVPGLFVIGEAVDVTGWLGGYNFQWAWSSGYVAGSVA
jgi:predicted Rossmann fold flavoprotein